MMVSTLISPKQGMGIGQVFIFIVAAITFAVIMIFGYNAVNEFLGKGEEVQFYQFKTDLETSVKTIYTEYGSVRIEQFYPPGDYHQICFVDLDDITHPAQSLCAKDPIACDVWQDAQLSGGYQATDENVFLKPPAPVKIKVYRLEAEGGFLCLDILDGRFDLVMEGRGSHTYLSPVS